MIWTFDENGCPTLQTEDSLPPNTVHLTREGEPLHLRRVAETEGVKMLGIHKALNIQEHSALQHLITKTHMFTNAIIACPIPQHTVIPAYYTIYIPSMMHSLPATAFIECELRQLH
eukprot:13671480-Ditylum_brightwellii.AAC.1